MNPVPRLLLSTAACFVVVGTTSAAPLPPPTTGETIVFLGNGLPEREQNYGRWETEFYQRFPDANLVIRNLGYQGDTPAFRPRPGQRDQWAFPGAAEFRPEFSMHFGRGHYDKPDDWLKLVKADTIIAFFGFNEAFDGPDHVERFRAELTAFVKHTLGQQYNGRSAPKLVLVSPIAFEDRSRDYDLPKGDAENRNFALYTDAIRAVAEANELTFVDLFSASKRLYSRNRKPLTVNGSHLNDDGYAATAAPLVEGIYGSGRHRAKAKDDALHAAVQEKIWMWFNDYRMLNGVHVHGQRYRPYGNVNYPEEIEKIRQMTALRDQKIWDVAQGRTTDLAVDDSKTRPLTPIETNFKPEIKYLDEAEALKSFTLLPGYEIGLFASEKEFPDMRNPVQMSFDNKGRLWVSVLHSYPHYVPGGTRPNDKILILEDTNGDGRADKQIVFADGLSLPIGFEITPEGVYASEEPNLILLKDHDGDDRADEKIILLGGFDSHDTHHAISAYTADASGAFYMCEGRFLHSQVETPYGARRCNDGGVWRFDPQSWRLERWSQADYNNPWGVTFDEWDQGYISDASSGDNFWALPVSAKMPYGIEIPKVDQFAPKRARPTSGTEFVSSRHFPDDVQGHFMICNSIGFLGVSYHDVWEEGSGFYGKVAGDLLSSTDPNFRPVDLETAPDGSLYIVDWHNALVGHMQHSARDPNRDTAHGRIYRITYPSRPLVTPPKIEGASIAQLLENLKLPEYRARYRTRRELREHPANKVIPAVKKWAAALDQKDPNYERYLCEALWATWAQNQVDRDLLQQCFSARSHQARAAAAQVLRHAWRKFPDSAAMFLRAANDPHPRVRLEAIVAASWLDNPTGARIALEAVKQPFDRWMGPVFDLIMKRTLADDVKELERTGALAVSLTDNPRATDFLAGKLDLAKIAPTEETKPQGPTRKLTDAEQKVYELGQEIFRRDGHCASCHQPNGAGLPNIYPPLVAKNNPWVTDSDERLIKIVLKGLWGPMELAGQQFDPGKGVPPMPGFGPVLNDDEIAAVINYVRQSFGNDLPFIAPATVQAVRAKTENRRDFYLVEDLMKEHPIPGWQEWQKAASKVESFE